MDPFALAAVVGLVFAGRQLASMPSRRPPSTRITRRDLDLAGVPGSGNRYKDFLDVSIMTPDVGRRVGDHHLLPKQEVGNLGDFSRDANRNPYGQPVYDLTGRQGVSNKMHNLPPVEALQIGPGIGVGTDVPSAGGFQSFFRVLPNNVNEEHLTSLEGRNGPSNALVKSGGTSMGEITHAAKDSKTWTRAPAQGRAQGQGGALTGPEGRPQLLKSERPTVRQATGERVDSLSTGPAQYGVSQPYGKVTDLNRSSGNRANSGRAGNAGGMNVRLDPVNQAGAMSSLRAESVQQASGAVNGSRFQNYRVTDYNQQNGKKGGLNPLASAANLDVAIRQLEKNPIAMIPLSVA